MIRLLIVAVTALAISLLWFIAWMHLANKLLEIRPQKEDRIRYLILTTALQIVYNIFLTIFPEFFAAWYNLSTILNFTIQGILMWYILYRHSRISHAAGAVSLSYFFLFSVSTTVEVLMNVFIYQPFTSRYPAEIFELLCQVIVSLLIHVFVLGISLLIGKLLDKTRFALYYSNLFEHPLRGGISCTACLLLMHVYNILPMFFPALEYSFSFFYMAVFADIIVLFLILFIAIFESNREKVKVQEDFIVQQQIYVKTLEGMQQELRSFRHDYQNLLSGLYLQAEEGNIADLQKTLQSTLHYFDDRLGNQIRKVTELSRIKLAPVKSLVMVKLVRADDLQVSLELEITADITHIFMSMGDFLRCLGILIDNALEAAVNMPDEPVCISMLQTDNALSILITNPCTRKPELHRMNDRGYTTKPTGQGIGLANYHKITNRYPNISRSSGFSEGRFHQEFRISKL